MSAIFEFIGNIFSIPFGFILGFFYDLTGSYILAIILLPLLVKLCLLPFSINQQKNMIQRTRLKLMAQQIKQRYENDPDKVQQKINALYSNDKNEKKGMGCLTFIIQFLVMIGVYDVINTPLTSILRLSSNTIDEMKTVMSKVIEAAGESSRMIEINLLNEASKYKEALISGNVLTEQTFNEIATLQDRFNFMGLDLALTPKFTQINALWLIPLLVLTVAMTSAIYSYVREKKQNPGSNKYSALDAITFVIPVLSFLFTFMFPAGVGLYWAIANLLSFVIQIFLNLIYNPNKIVIDALPEEVIIEPENNNNEEKRD